MEIIAVVISMLNEERSIGKVFACGIPITYRAREGRLKLSSLWDGKRISLLCTSDVSVNTIERRPNPRKKPRGQRAKVAYQKR